MTILPQPKRTSSPWSLLYRLRMLLWSTTWTVSCRLTPKPFNSYRIFVLRLFGAIIDRGCFVHQRAVISHPWHLVMRCGSCLGDSVHIYSLAPVILGPGVVVAQQAYLCTATHDFNQHSYPLITRPITIQEDAFIGARAFILPGITIGARSIVGACSVVTRSIDPQLIVAGNPAKPIRKR